jgi:hypothetical protein
MPPQLITPEFVVMRCQRDPRIFRNFNHPNYLLAPRAAIRWLAANESTDTLNAWLASPAMRSAIGCEAAVIDTKEGRVWEYRDDSGKFILRVSGRHKDGTTRPIAVGDNTVLRATTRTVTHDAVSWEFPANEGCTFSAKLRLPKGDADPEIGFTLAPRRDAFFSVAFTGAPAIAREEMARVPQECGGRSQLMTLPLAGGRSAAVSKPPPAMSSFIMPAPASPPAPPADFHVTDDFIAYLKTAANPLQLGLRNGRYYPYSTPLGRRIAWGLAVWDKAFFAEGCTPAEAEWQLRAVFAKAEEDWKRVLSERQPVVEVARLDQRQQETLLDFAHTQGAADIPPPLLAAVLAADWPRLARDHLYIRYNGPAPDHTRNKAFAARWNIR